MYLELKIVVDANVRYCEALTTSVKVITLTATTFKMRMCGIVLLTFFASNEGELRRTDGFSQISGGFELRFFLG